MIGYVARLMRTGSTIRGTIRPSSRNIFKKSDKKDPPNVYDDDDVVDVPMKKFVLEELPRDLKEAYKQIKDGLRRPPYEVELHEAFTPKVVWKFDGSKETLDKWHTSSDSDCGVGYSSCSLTYSLTGKAIFSGTLDTRIPKDGRQTKAGFCNLSVKPEFFLYSIQSMDWTMYNHLVLRVRGDGRSYIINVRSKGLMDISYYDTFHYPLHTRGGPYWQTVELPFSKFVFGAKGHILDRQGDFPLDEVTHFGITIADRKSGPFKLEIDYIGLMDNPAHDEERAFEDYKQS